MGIEDEIKLPDLGLTKIDYLAVEIVKLALRKEVNGWPSPEGMRLMALEAKRYARIVLDALAEK